MLSGLGAELLIQVHREERGRGVECACHRAHERREQSRHHDAANARGQQILHHEGKRRLSGLSDHVPLRIHYGAEPRDLAGLRERECDQAGYDEDEHREQLQVRGENAAAARRALVLGAQGALHDVLVRTPVPQADDRRAQQHARPRVAAVEVPGDAAGFLHRGPRALHPGGDDGLPQVEQVRVEHPAQLVPAAEPRKPVRREETRSHDEDERLQGVGVRDRPHPAEHRVEPGEQHDRHGADPEAVERGASDVQPHLGQECREDDPPCEDRDRELREHVRRQRDHRQHPASGG